MQLGHATGSVKINTEYTANTTLASCLCSEAPMWAFWHDLTGEADINKTDGFSFVLDRGSAVVVLLWDRLTSIQNCNLIFFSPVIIFTLLSFVYQGRPPNVKSNFEPDNKQKKYRQPTYKTISNECKLQIMWKCRFTLPCKDDCSLSTNEAIHPSSLIFN